MQPYSTDEFLARATELGVFAFARGIRRVPLLDDGLLKLFFQHGIRCIPQETMRLKRAWCMAWDYAKLCEPQVAA